MKARDPINVLHTIDTTGPGGAETVFRELALGLDPDKYRSFVAVAGEGWLHDDLRRHGLKPYLVPGQDRSFSLSYLWALVRLIRRHDIHVVQSHLFGSNVYCSLAGLLTRTPVVSTFHGVVDVNAQDPRLRLKFRLINAGSRHVVFVSDFLRHQMLDVAPLNPSKCVRIYNGIDLRRYRGPVSQDLRVQLGLDVDAVLVGALGNIRRSKGYDVLLQAAARLNEREPGRYHVVIGGQPDRGGLYDALLEQRRSLGLEDHVHFLGHLEDAAGFLQQLDVFVLSSTSEGLSIATLEAMAASVPVVCTRSGGPEEIVTDGVTGLLVSPGDPRELAEALARTADDPTGREHRARQARELVEAEFSLAAMVGEYSRLYASSLGIPAPADAVVS